MIDFTEAEFSALSIHYIGNRLKEEGLKLSDRNVLSELDHEGEATLMRFFLKPFSTEELFVFSHSSNVQLNEVYSFATKIFADNALFKTLSKDICRHLYECSNHPKIKAGEVYVALFKNCQINGKTVDALGIFKSENKDTFINIEFSKTALSKISFLEGIDPKHLDKGCVIFNTDAQQGFDVVLVDNSSRGGEAQFWRDDFLGVLPQQNNYYQTAQFLKMCKEFVVNELPKQFEVEKTDQIGLLNRSVDYFKKSTEFEGGSFAEDVFEQPALINSFEGFKQHYQTENNINYQEGFEISGSAVKRQARTFKSVLKLDKNFHVYIHGDRNLIEKGFDEQSGKHFYKIYFDEEA